MHSVLALTASSLTALLLTCVAAGAQPAAGWVDPPEREEAAQAKAAEPATDAAASSDRFSRPARPRLTLRPEPEAGAPASDGRRLRRSEQAERRQERRRAAVPSEIDTRAVDPGADRWAGQAQRLTGDYLESVSAPNGAMLSDAPRFYGSQVRFHGRSMSIAALMAEKRRFVRRWPERRYTPQDGTMRTACDAASATCVVRTVMGFSAGNPARSARSQGLSELSLTVSFAGERPVIVSESSRVLRRGTAALSSAERGRQGGA